ncbi:cytokinin dehydrogenase 3-like protein [Tanacetum coccineum]
MGAHKHTFRQRCHWCQMGLKVKFNADGSVERNKARLVAKGYSQQPGIKYDETFAAVARMDTIQAIISLEAIKVALYVDDLVFAGNNKKMIEDFKNEMMQKYEISDLGLLNNFPRMKIYQDDGGVFICQEKYVEKILKNFDMLECKSKDTPLVINEKLMKEDGSSKVDATLYRSLMGKLLYLTDTRPDIIEAIEDGEVQLEFCGTNDQCTVVVCGGMERGFLSQKGSGVGKGVKEKGFNRIKKNTFSGISVSRDSDDTINDDTPDGVASAVQEGITPSVVDMMVEMEKHNSLDDTTVPECFPPLSTPVTTTAGNASSYANITSKPSGKKVNVRTLFTPGGNEIDVVVPVHSIRAISKRFGKYGLVRSMFISSTGLLSFQFSSMDGLDAMLENGLWFIRNNPLILKKWHPDENLLKKDVSTVPVWVKLHGVPVTAFSEDGLSAITTKLGRSSYARVMVELRADVELKDNTVMPMPKITRDGHYTCNDTSAGEKNTIKPSQTFRDVSVGPKMGFKPQKEYRHVLKNPNASSSGNKKKGTVNNGATPSGSTFMNIDNDGEFASNTPIGEKIDKIERQIGEGNLRLLDNDGNPLVPTGIMESDSEVEVVFDETANLKISTSGKDGSDKGYGTNSLLKQWRDSYPDNDDFDPYDDDMYENHDLSEHLQSICGDLDIMVRGRKKK